MKYGRWLRRYDIHWTSPFRDFGDNSVQKRSRRFCVEQSVVLIPAVWGYI